MDLWTCGAVFFSMDLFFQMIFPMNCKGSVFLFEGGDWGIFRSGQNCQMYGGQNQMNNEKTLVA